MTLDFPVRAAFRALILAAGRGRRLGGGDQQPPKVLLRFGGETLLARHLRLLERAGAGRVSLVVGYRREAIEAELERIGRRGSVDLIENAAWQQGSVVSLDRAGHLFDGAAPVVLMDGDVIYDHRLLERLLGGCGPGTLLLDREIEPGDEPVKICVAGLQRIVDFAKRPDVTHDWHGESVGFFRFAPRLAVQVATAARALVAAGGDMTEYEASIRGLIRADEDGTVFGFEDVTGLPWTEIDVMDDVEKAQALLPSLAS
ncbi:NTP transferase domain-containing protein [Lichenicoccus sp.]|uniref:phosphocholine cytidylyltransferase family protein n=1 Tax=Lichenicoccus sp. TaxID=2781899 RepID=UPI003D0DF3FB